MLLVRCDNPTCTTEREIPLPEDGGGISWPDRWRWVVDRRSWTTRPHKYLFCSLSCEEKARDQIMALWED